MKKEFVLLQGVTDWKLHILEDGETVTTLTQEEALELYSHMPPPSIDKWSVAYMERKIRDILNWAKGELAELEHPKLGKTATPYSTEKKLFLTKVIQKLT